MLVHYQRENSSGILGRMDAVKGLWGEKGSQSRDEKEREEVGGDGERRRNYNQVSLPTFPHFRILKINVLEGQRVNILHVWRILFGHK